MLGIPSLSRGLRRGFAGHALRLRSPRACKLRGGGLGWGWGALCLKTHPHPNSFPLKGKELVDTLG